MSDNGKDRVYKTIPQRDLTGICITLQQGKKSSLLSLSLSPDTKIINVLQTATLGLVAYLTPFSPPKSPPQGERIDLSTADNNNNKSCLILRERRHCFDLS